MAESRDCKIGKHRSGIIVGTSNTNQGHRDQTKTATLVRLNEEGAAAKDRRQSTPEVGVFDE